MLGITGRLLQDCRLGLGLGLGFTLGLGLGLANSGPNPNATLSPSCIPEQDCVHEIERMQVSDGGGGEVRLLPRLPGVVGLALAVTLTLPRCVFSPTCPGWLGFALAVTLTLTLTLTLSLTRTRTRTLTLTLPRCASSRTCPWWVTARRARRAYSYPASSWVRPDPIALTLTLTLTRRRTLTLAATPTPALTLAATLARTLALPLTRRDGGGRRRAGPLPVRVGGCTPRERANRGARRG